MKLARLESWREAIPLSRPYEIAYKTTDAVELVLVRLIDDRGNEGLGSASPAEYVTGETVEACARALDPARFDAWIGRDVRHLGALTRELGGLLPDNPAARAAIDMALWDLFARSLGVPLVDHLGRCHDGLPTSITVGIKSVGETVAEAEEYRGRGFDHLKIKLGRSFAEDEERLCALRERLGGSFRIRVDANQGYSPQETLALEGLAKQLDIELIEQPLPAKDVDSMRELPLELRRRIAADESLLTERDAQRLATDPPACGIFNIKLMKCGGVTPALGIARTAALADVEVMWGCNDESAISIAAALHAAYACPATRFLDLDGSFDLSRDPGLGGFAVRDGRLYVTDEPGLGVRLRDRD